MKSKRQQHKSELHCGYCGKEFKYVSERNRHEQSHSPQFECKVCSKKFSFLSAVRRHEKQHERTGNVVCSECDRKFRDESLLKRHIKYAHKGSFTCTKCEATFSCELALRTHTKSHKPVEERQYHCSFHGCTKSFNFSHHLKHHELTHTNMKQHFCNICGKGFIQSHHLKSHKKTHEPDRWLNCGFLGCKKTFPTEYARKKHFAKHRRDIKSEDSNCSNNSSCDITDEIQPDTVKCGTCEQIILRQNYSKHIENCVDNDTAIRLDSNTPNTNLALKLEPIKIDYSDDIGGCKSFVGGCILGEHRNSNEKCLCAQISAALPADVYYDLNENVNNSEIFNDNEIAKPNKSDDACVGCECAGSFKSVAKTNDSYNKDESLQIVEYGCDGTVKIKNTCDLDIDTCKEEADLVPYSCKAVLGNCIVSGNGTIGEGCLCARMAGDDQQLMTQEIEELTPCPKIG